MFMTLYVLTVCEVWFMFCAGALALKRRTTGLPFSSYKPRLQVSIPKSYTGTSIRTGHVYTKETITGPLQQCFLLITLLWRITPSSTPYPALRFMGDVFWLGINCGNRKCFNEIDSGDLHIFKIMKFCGNLFKTCLLYTSPSPRD